MAFVAQALEWPCEEPAFVTTVRLDVVDGCCLHHFAPLEMAVA
jgi:hypothetical protein